MKAKRISLVLAVVICLAAIAPVALAATTSYCQRLVNGNQCGKSLYWKHDGRSINYPATHKYGGFLGIGSKTCYAYYYYNYYIRQCNSGHIAGYTENRSEVHPSCGK